MSPTNKLPDVLGRPQLISHGSRVGPGLGQRVGGVSEFSPHGSFAPNDQLLLQLRSLQHGTRQQGTIEGSVTRCRTYAGA